MTDWLFYWTPDKLRYTGDPMDEAYSAYYREVAPGDTAWIVTVSKGCLLLLGRIVIERIGPGLYDFDKVRVYARAGTVVNQSRLDITHLVPSLEMASPTKGIQVSGNALQRPRPFTSESARMIRAFWEGNGTASIEADPPPPATWLEGARTSAQVNRYERETSPEARAACLAVHGKFCWVCGFDFEDVYGPLGANFIYLHHRIPVAVRAAGGEYQLDPVRDLIPLCGNCHPMVHIKEPSFDDLADRDSENGVEANDAVSEEAESDEEDEDEDEDEESLVGWTIRFVGDDGATIVGVVTEHEETKITVKPKVKVFGTRTLDLDEVEIEPIASQGLSWERLLELRQEAAWEPEPRPRR